MMPEKFGVQSLSNKMQQPNEMKHLASVVHYVVQPATEPVRVQLDVVQPVEKQPNVVSSTAQSQPVV
ncbi:hypothetical protein DEO72_LG3g186 [Vigna unguiculata]|uniref:Uncharacterized protein n=1 Tax=Vigna unguiculata TaxID=3917 RepID=A0A4D6LB93_VIGUN|nr:hypothetical protein DEO72_LG3g186 [Vigna unguiculata]